MTDLESLIVTEARRQGHQPDRHAITQAAIDLAGGTMTKQGLINLPGRGCISPADFVRSLRNTMPAAFTPMSDEATIATDERRSGETVTAHMTRLVEANRKPARMPDDWQEVRGRYPADSLTGKMLREREREWR